MTLQTKAMVMGSFVVFFWATAATAFKIALSGMGYFELLMIASFTTLLISAVEISYSGKWSKILKVFEDQPRLVKFSLQGLLNPLLYYLVLFKAYSLLPAQIAQPLNYSWQIVLVLMISLVFKQKLGISKLIGVFISFAGILALSFNSGASATGELSVTGILLALGSAFIWATFWISKINVNDDPSVSLFFNFLAGSIYLLIISFFVETSLPPFKSVLAGVYVGVFEMGITFILWGKALNTATNKLMLTQLTYLAPVISLLLIALVLQEKIGPLTIFGLIAILSGIAIANINRRVASKDLDE